MISKSTEFLPITLGISTITCSLPWLVFGLVISNLTIWLPNACGLIFGSLQVAVYVWLSRCASTDTCDSGTSSFISDGKPNASVQKIATAGDIFLFIGGRIDARTLPTVQTWAGTPLCLLGGALEDSDAQLPRANSAPSQPGTPKLMSAAERAASLRSLDVTSPH